MSASILSAIVDNYQLRRGNGRYTGQCPKCGGSKDSNKFVIRDDCGFKCYTCGFKGDVITWLREMEQKTCPEAHEASGQACTRTGCGVWSTCRMGDGSGRATAPGPRRRSVTPRPSVIQRDLPVVTEKQPAQIWQEWASELVAKASEAIEKQAAVLTWLASRGIPRHAVHRFELGWLDHDRKVERAAIGLPPRDDGKTTLWVPGGLLIPILDETGRIHRLRIRRTNEARAKFLPDLKYVWLDGSGNGPLVIRSQGRSRGTVIVEAELDAYACAAAHAQVTVIAIGSVACGLPAALRQELLAAPVILVALDADPGRDGKQGAGPAAIAAWSQIYRQARFWPLPTGKDPGDYAKAGGDLHAWIEAGLPPVSTAASHPGAKNGQSPENPAMRSTTASPTQTASGQLLPAASSTPAHDLGLCPERPQPGEGGEQTITDDYQIVTMLDGREFYITASEPTWHALTMAGKVVFSQNELERLKVACGAMSPAELAQAALLAVDLKETFPSAYIQAGRVSKTDFDI